MRRLLLAVGIAIAAGCSDYNLQPDASIHATPNPPELGTPLQLDRIVQVTVPSVDVLWVVDNSCSMSEEQTAIAVNFPKFVNYFLDSGLDYHIGVVSTGWDNSSERGKLRDGEGGQRWIDDATVDPLSAFDRMARMGTSGPDQEKGRAQVYGAMNLLEDSYNAGFQRDGAYLAIIVISDEDDVSGNAPISKSEFIGWLNTMKPREGMVTFSSIVGPRGGCATAAGGDQYLDVTQAVGGIEWSICSSDWDRALEELGMQAAGLRREFFLSQVPVPDSITVTVVEDGTDYTFDEGSDWLYDRSRNSVRFVSYVPNALSEVFIEYEVLAAFEDPDEDA